MPYTAGGHSGLLWAFIIAELGDLPAIVFMEDACGGRVSEDAAMVSQPMRNLDAMRSEALRRGVSRDLMEKVTAAGAGIGAVACWGSVIAGVGAVCESPVARPRPGWPALRTRDRRQQEIPKTSKLT